MLGMAQISRMNRTMSGRESSTLRLISWTGSFTIFSADFMIWNALCNL